MRSGAAFILHVQLHVAYRRTSSTWATQPAKLQCGRNMTKTRIKNFLRSTCVHHQCPWLRPLHHQPDTRSKLQNRACLASRKARNTCGGLLLMPLYFSAAVVTIVLLLQIGPGASNMAEREFDSARRSRLPVSASTEHRHKFGSLN